MPGGKGKEEPRMSRIWSTWEQVTSMGLGNKGRRKERPSCLFRQGLSMVIEAAHCSYSFIGCGYGFMYLILGKTRDYIPLGGRTRKHIGREVHRLKAKAIQIPRLHGEDIQCYATYLSSPGPLS